MNSHVIDSSVLIAVFKGEPLSPDILHVIEGSALSTVNYAEVWSKLHSYGIASDPYVDELFSLLGSIEPFTASQAELSALLRGKTAHAGLSLGDRACLALALELGADVYTADKEWARVDAGCTVHLVR